MAKNLQQFLKGKLTVNEARLIPSSFDVIGDILIYSDFPKELVKRQKIVGEAILKLHPNIKVVAKKARQYSGTYRLPRLSIIAGERRKETVHRENGISLKLNPEKVYFSPRLATDRRNVASLVKAGETILVMFSGCGPYTITLAKNSSCKKVVGVEINPIAHAYAVENAKRNKVEGKVLLCRGDVGKVLPKIRQKFDRILMPLPKNAEEFLPIALSKIKKRGTIHFYDFLGEKEFGIVKEKIGIVCSAAEKTCSVAKIVKCGQYSPGMFRVRADIQVS